MVVRGLGELLNGVHFDALGATITPTRQRLASAPGSILFPCKIALRANANDSLKLCKREAGMLLHLLHKNLCSLGVGFFFCLHDSFDVMFDASMLSSQILSRKWMHVSVR